MLECFVGRVLDLRLDIILENPEKFKFEVDYVRAAFWSLADLGAHRKEVFM